MASSPRDILAIVLQLNRHAVPLNDGNRLHGHREILVNYAPGGFIGVFVLLLFEVTVQLRLLQRNLFNARLTEISPIVSAYANVNFCYVNVK